MQWQALRPLQALRYYIDMPYRLMRIALHAVPL